MRNLMEGHSLRVIAECSCRSENVVRSQAKSVLAKTGAPEQAGLIRLVAFPISRGNPLRSNGYPGSVNLNDEVLEKPTGLKMQRYQPGDLKVRPVIYLHGALDPVVTICAAEEFAGTSSNTTFHVLEDVGQFLIY
ncbi:helix-turn-helix transcriptional regulator [Ruegeria marisflavi]|uniref:helix-turn-helix transcriptional regulator n=1 Tax=Ruegeria marisflavi TaxID=2984152 RepID=UPI0021DF77ED|nr:hypothetical protein [Ruegeria sp. WL0004]